MSAAGLREPLSTHPAESLASGDTLDGQFNTLREIFPVLARWSCPHSRCPVMKGDRGIRCCPSRAEHRDKTEHSQASYSGRALSSARWQRLAQAWLDPNGESRGPWLCISALCRSDGRKRGVALILSGQACQ